MNPRLKLPFSVLGIFLLSLSACNNNSKNQAGEVTTAQTADSSANAAPEVSLPIKADFQSTVSGKKTDLYVLKNKNNVQAAITN